MPKIFQVVDIAIPIDQTLKLKKHVSDPNSNDHFNFPCDLICLRSTRDTKVVYFYRYDH